MPVTEMSSELSDSGAQSLFVAAMLTHTPTKPRKFSLSSRTVSQFSAVYFGLSQFLADRALFWLATSSTSKVFFRGLASTLLLRSATLSTPATRTPSMPPTTHADFGTESTSQCRKPPQRISNEVPKTAAGSVNETVSDFW